MRSYCSYCPPPITEAEPIGRSMRCGACGKGPGGV
jgi:hypothetical protein